MTDNDMLAQQAAGGQFNTAYDACVAAKGSYVDVAQNLAPAAKPTNAALPQGADPMPWSGMSEPTGA